MFKSFIDSVYRMGVTIVVLCGGFTACASHDELAPPRIQAITTHAADLSQTHAAKVAGARARVRFVGESHRAAMSVIFEAALANRAARKKMPSRGSQEYCALLERAGRAAMKVISAARAVPLSQSEQDRKVQSLPELVRCNEGAPSTPPGHMASLQEIDGLGPEVTGDYEAYLPLMEAQLASSDWSVPGVTAAMNDVLATAASNGIAEGDLLALAAFAEFSEASAAEWNSVQWAPVVDGASPCSGTRCLTSFFRKRSFAGNVGKVVSADVTGCLSSVKSWSALKLLLALPAWKALAGECGVRGAIGSAIAVIALM